MTLLIVGTILCVCVVVVDCVHCNYIGAHSLCLYSLDALFRVSKIPYAKKRVYKINHCIKNCKLPGVRPSHVYVVIPTLLIFE